MNHFGRHPELAHESTLQYKVNPVKTHGVTIDLVLPTASTIREQMAGIGLGRMAAAIAARRLPSLRLTPGKPCAEPVSRLGGLPNLPREIAWPVWQSGQPLAFIAQLDLAALPAVRGFALPRTGSLFFFYDADSQPWGFSPKDKGSARVICVSTPLAANPPCAAHRDLDEDAEFKGVALTAHVEMTLPGMNSGILREFEATDSEAEAFQNLVDPLVRPVHRSGGHAEEIQGSLRLEAQLVTHGIDCGSGRGYDKGRKMGLDAGAADWRLLLQVDTEPRTGMVWGDVGRIYFMIHKDALRRRQFDQVWLILQCT